MANPLDNLKPYKPGDPRINRGGRPAVSKEWREKCQKFMMDLGGFDELVRIANDKANKEQLKALMFIADHAMGKAVQQIAGADEEDFNKLKIVITRDTSGTDNESSNAAEITIASALTNAADSDDNEDD